MRHRTHLSRPIDTGAQSVLTPELHSSTARTLNVSGLVMSAATTVTCECFFNALAPTRSSVTGAIKRTQHREIANTRPAVSRKCQHTEPTQLGVNKIHNLAHAR
jgi:hypothetical protein